MGGEYPKRSRFFANHFVRVMAKACLANDVGPEACWLITVVAFTEDAKGYRAPVTFFNEQLMPLVGLKNVKALDRARDKAVASGWLVYSAGGKSKPGRYWVEIPAAHRNWDDAPTDESAEGADYSGSKSTQETGEKREESGREAGDKREVSGRETGEKREESGQHSSLSRPLSLSRSQRQTDPQTPVASAPASEPEPFDPLRAEQAARKLFEQRWSTAGLRQFSRLSPSNQTRLVALLLDPWWAEHYPAALERAGRIPWLRSGTGRARGAYDVSEFLRDSDEARKILDGVYDPRVSTAPPAGTGPPAPAPAPNAKPLKETGLDRMKRIAEANGVKVIETKAPEPAPCPAPPPSPPPTGTSSGSPTTPPRSGPPSTSAA